MGFIFRKISLFLAYWNGNEKLGTKLTFKWSKMFYPKYGIVKVLYFHWHTVHFQYIKKNSSVPVYVGNMTAMSSPACPSLIKSPRHSPSPYLIDCLSSLAYSTNNEVIFHNSTSHFLRHSAPDLHCGATWGSCGVSWILYWIRQQASTMPVLWVI